MKVRVVVTGRSYHAAEPLPAELELVDAADVEDALRLLHEHLPAGQKLPPSCLLIVSGQHLGTLAHHAPRVLCDGDELALIAPVAGG